MSPLEQLGNSGRVKRRCFFASALFPLALQRAKGTESRGPPITLEVNANEDASEDYSQTRGFPQFHWSKNIMRDRNSPRNWCRKCLAPKLHPALPLTLAAPWLAQFP
ncbi:hypothetical protein BS50DRAFT_629233 [Corynespora cassiicola Philippines]|uniref:Uncharacterized protein n=1 Tax=Corynespora cassiicola Philippines TaxID=1448308 RepID=A0A2T2P6C4_CORCC|nr:hypothetical protein BS50DRAFT_629233 [Corynespora cassiicola Philippines]